MSDSTNSSSNVSCGGSCIPGILIVASIVLIILKYTGVAASIPLWVSLLPGAIGIGLIVVSIIFVFVVLGVGASILQRK